MTTRTQQAARRRWVLPFLAALVAILATILSSASASAATTVGAETRVRASAVAVEVLVGPPQHIAAGQRLREAAPRAGYVVATGVAANGGAAAVRMGQAGEAAVRGAYDIGPKATRVIGGRTRIFDGLSDEAVSEVKNVGYQAYTQQLKDSLAYAQQNGLRFDLFVRGGATPTRLSGPLETAIRNGDITLRYIP